MEQQSERRDLVFLLGGGAYFGLETLCRGYSHWTMILAGGACCLFLWDIFYGFAGMPLWQKAILGAFAITLVELAVGIVANLWFGWRVWDYSNMTFHLLGQVCPAFTCLWFALAICLFHVMNRAALA